MVIDASVSEAEVHRVRPSQPAAIRVEAFPDLRLSGKGDTRRRAGARVGRSAVTTTSASISSSSSIRLDADLRPEMTARADIVVGTRTGVLLVPVNAVFQQRDVTVCHVVRPFGIETRQVELGESNDVMVEVVSEAERRRPGHADRPGQGATPA